VAAATVVKHTNELAVRRDAIVIERAVAETRSGV
jgi:hypothetical protein